MRILDDLTKARTRRYFPSHVVIDRGNFAPEPGKPVGAKAGGETHRWGTFHMAEHLETRERQNVVDDHFERPSKPRQHQTHVKRNVQRLYRPQDQSMIHPRFAIMDRVEGQVLARVRGTVNYVEREAEKLARSQACELADLKIRIEGAE